MVPRHVAKKDNNVHHPHEIGAEGVSLLRLRNSHPLAVANPDYCQGQDLDFTCAAYIIDFSEIFCFCSILFCLFVLFVTFSFQLQA